MSITTTKIKVGVFNVLAAGMSSSSETSLNRTQSNNLFHTFRNLSLLMYKAAGSTPSIVQLTGEPEKKLSQIYKQNGKNDIPEEEKTKILNAIDLVFKAVANGTVTFTNMDPFSLDILQQLEDAFNAALATAAAGAATGADAVDDAQFKTTFGMTYTDFDNALKNDNVAAETKYGKILKQLSATLNIGYYGGFNIGDMNGRMIESSVYTDPRFRKDFYFKKKKFMKAQITNFMNDFSAKMLICPECDYELSGTDLQNIKHLKLGNWKPHVYYSYNGLLQAIKETKIGKKKVYTFTNQEDQGKVKTFLNTYYGDDILDLIETQFNSTDTNNVFAQFLFNLKKQPKSTIFTTGSDNSIPTKFNPDSNFFRYAFFKGGNWELLHPDVPITSSAGGTHEPISIGLDDDIFRSLRRLHLCWKDTNILELKVKRRVDVLISSLLEQVLVSVHLDSTTSANDWWKKEKELAELKKLCIALHGHSQLKDFDIIVAGDFNYPYYTDFAEFKAVVENGFDCPKDDLTGGISLDKKKFGLESTKGDDAWPDYIIYFNLSDPNSVAPKVGICKKKRFNDTVGNDQLWEGKSEERSYNTDFIGCVYASGQKVESQTSKLEEVRHKSSNYHPYVGVLKYNKIDDFSWLSDHALVYKTFTTEHKVVSWNTQSGGARKSKRRRRRGSKRRNRSKTSIRNSRKKLRKRNSRKVRKNTRKRR